MQPGFWNIDLLTRARDGRNFTLAEALYHLDDDGTITACPAGSMSDGISTPTIVWATDPPFGIGRWFPGIWHDCSPKYRCTLMQWFGNHWGVAQFTFEECNSTLRRQLIRLGMTSVKADAYFEALQLAGGMASTSDLGIAVGRIIVPPPPPWL